MGFENQVLEDFTVPNIENVPFKSIEKKYLRVVVVNYIFLLLLLFSSVGLAVFLFHVPLSEVLFGGIVLLLFLLLTASFIVSVLSFSKRKYALRTRDISYKKGLFTTTLTTVPFVRVQHIDVKQGFFSRKLNLANLEVYTAGESGGDLTIKGLKYQDANSIREYIMSKIDA